MKQEQAPAQVITCGDESATESQTANINTAASPNGRVVVPRDRRRGYFTRFTVIPETEDPTKDKPSEKWIITTVVALCGAVGPLGGAVIMPALSLVGDQFGADEFTSSMTLSVYMLAMAVFPLWWSSASELIGRRPVYMASNLCFALFSAVSVVSPSLGVFLVMRFFTGGAASAALSVGAGTIADIWEPKERGRAMGYYLLGPLCGPLISPIIGGGLTQAFGWDSSLWFLCAYGVVMTLLVIFALPETSAPPKRTVRRTDSATSSLAASSESVKMLPFGQKAFGLLSSFAAMFNRILIQPFALLAFLRFPPVALTVYVHSLSFGAIYFINISLESTFSSQPYSFPQWAIGLVFAPMSIGFMTAGLAGGRWTDRIMRRRAVERGVDEQGNLVYLPEDRMRENAWLGLLVYPLATVWYGWSVKAKLMWAGVLAPTLLIGFSSFLLISMSTTMLTEFMPGRSASGVAINNLGRNLISFAATMATAPWVDAIGAGWVMTIVAIWLLSLVVVVLLMYKHGSRWRAEMNDAMRRRAGN